MTGWPIAQRCLSNHRDEPDLDRPTEDELPQLRLTAR